MRARTAVAAMVFLALAGVIGAACGGSKRTSTAPAPARSFGGVAAPSPASDSGTEGKAPPPGLPVLAQHVIKTASLTLRLRDGSFEQRFQEATQVAARYGGFVSSSDSSSGKHRSGTIVIRVPADQFENALGAIKGLGTVSAERISGQDVTAQFVDLEARLRNWEAQESVLLGLMSKATSIEDSIRVQGHLEDVQLTIEELKGQLRVLDDQADFSTITIGMSEVGFVAPTAKPRSSLSEAWHDAVDGFVGVIAAVIVGLGYLVPLALLTLIAWGLVRRLGSKVTTGPKVTRPA